MFVSNFHKIIDMISCLVELRIELCEGWIAPCISKLLQVVAQCSGALIKLVGKLLQNSGEVFNLFRCEMDLVHNVSICERE